MYKPARSRRVVQTRAPTADGGPACTDSAIDQSVQADQVVEMQIGAFRKGLKAVLDGEQAVILGSSWRPRGIILPVRARWHYRDSNGEERNKILVRLLQAALQRLGG